MEFTAEERAQIRAKLTEGSAEVDWGHESPCWKPMWSTYSSIMNGRASIWWSGRYYAGDRLAYMAWIGPLGSATRLELTCHVTEAQCRDLPHHCMHLSCINPDHLTIKPSAARPADPCTYVGCLEPRNPPYSIGASGSASRYCLYHRVATQGWTVVSITDRKLYANRWVRDAAARIGAEYPPDPLTEPVEYASWIALNPSAANPARTRIPDVDRVYVFIRDAWRCAICRRAMLHPDDPRLTGPLDPRYPTIDHHMPVSLGGTNELANLRAAHRVCNIRRGNRMHNEQFALFG